MWAYESPDGEGGHVGKVRAEVAIGVRDAPKQDAVGEVVLVYRAKLLEGDETALNLTQVGFSVASEVSMLIQRSTGRLTWKPARTRETDRALRRTSSSTRTNST